MRKRGPSGGGTLRRKSPQQGQRPSSSTGPVTSTRIQWPRASHIGLMHCTVKPGKYCIVSPQGPHGSNNPTANLALAAARRNRSFCGPAVRRGPLKENAGPEIRSSGHGNRGPRGNSELDGAHSALRTLWCQEKNTTRYCGKVANCGKRWLRSAGQRRGTRHIRSKKPPGNRMERFCVLKSEGGVVLHSNEPQDGGKNAWSKV